MINKPKMVTNAASRKLMNAGSKQIRMTRLTGKDADPARQSELRIMGAMQTLSGSIRGQAVLDDLALIVNGQAKGLDSSGMSALVCIVREFALGGRRGFLIKPEARPKLKKVSPACKRWQVMRGMRCYRIVFALSAGEACDIVRADDSNAGEFYEVEVYHAVEIPVEEKRSIAWPSDSEGTAR